MPNLDLDNHASLLHQILISDVIPEVWNTLADSPSPICQVGGGNSLRPSWRTTRLCVDAGIPRPLGRVDRLGEPLQRVLIYKSI